MKTFRVIFALFLPVATLAQAVPNQEQNRSWITDVNIVSPEKPRAKKRREEACRAQRWFREMDSF